MEIVPDTTNVHYIDEYPELAKKVWMRRLEQSRLPAKVVEAAKIIYLPETPDDAA